MVTLTAGTSPLDMSLYAGFGRADGLLATEPALVSVPTTTGYLIDFHGRFDLTNAATLSQSAVTGLDISTDVHRTDLIASITDLHTTFGGFQSPDFPILLKGNDHLIGSTGNDTLQGFAGNDLIDGGPGADHMEGGRGNDTYVVDTLGDTITELPKGGVDTVLSAFSFTLPDQVEILTLTGTGGIDGTGNERANILVGNDAANRLDGGAGNNRLEGNGGDDVLLGGTGKDLLLGGAGNDHLESGGGKDKLDGGLGDDELVAGSRSSLTGGADADSFVLGPGVIKVTLTDFTTADGDVLVLRDVLKGYDPATSDIADFVRLTGKGSTVQVAVDPEGDGTGYAKIATVRGDLGTDLHALINDGHIVVEAAPVS
jgi:Ca2+-binding RTX toxin-like protein